MSNKFVPDFSFDSKKSFVPDFGLGDKTKERKTLDLTDIKTLEAVAKSKGLKVKKDKPSLFRRTIDLLSRGNYMSANIVKDFIDGDEFKPITSGWRGLSGQDKTTYSDVLKVAGMQNKILRGGLGFALDVALDPTTYFGGSLIKGAGKVTKAVTKPVGKTISKVAPEFANHMIDAGKSIEDAFGAAFKWGYKVTPEVSEESARVLNKIGIAKEEITNKYIDIFKPLNKTQQKEFAETLIKNRKKIRMYEKPRVKELMKENKDINKALSVARKEANEKFIPKFADETQATVFKTLKKDINELSNKVGLDDAFKIDAYYPIMDIDKMKKADRLNRVFEQGRKGYEKEYKDKVAFDKTLKNPIESYSRVAFEVERNKLSREVLQTAVDTYGLSKNTIKNLAKKNVDELKGILDKAGIKYSGIEDPDVLRGLIKESFKEIKDKTMGGKTIGFLKKRDTNFINDQLFPEFKTIDVMAKTFGYDKATNFFKKAVTAWFPAFHSRNFISGVAQSYEVFGKEAFNPRNYNTALGVLKKGNKVPLSIGKWKGTTNELRTAIKENFEGSSRYISDLGDYIKEIAPGKFSMKKIKDPGRQLGNAIETYHKTVGTIIGLRQGKSLNESLRLAEKAGFDYRKITKFESKIMKRLIPFYTFMKKNAVLQFDTFKYHPERIINQAKLANGFSEMFGGKVTEDDIKGLPNWVLSGLGFKLQDNKYVSQFGLPLEEFIQTVNSPLHKTLTSLNPIIKYPLESKLGYDFFREKEIVDIDNVAPASGEKLWELQAEGRLPQWFEDSINLKRHKYKGKYKYTASPKALHILRNIPTSRVQNTFEKLFDKDLNPVNKWTAFFSGMKVYDIDQEQQEYFKEKDLRNDIEKQLLNIGEGKQFKTFYIYK